MFSFMGVLALSFFLGAALPCGSHGPANHRHSGAAQRHNDDRLKATSITAAGNLAGDSSSPRTDATCAM